MRWEKVMLIRVETCNSENDLSQAIDQASKLIIRIPGCKELPVDVSSYDAIEGTVWILATCKNNSQSCVSIACAIWWAVSFSTLLAARDCRMRPVA